MPRIAALNIYPVKSCRGIALDTARLTATGFEFDREWMVTQPDGEFVTQRELPRLALIETRLTADALHLSAPGVLPLAVKLAGDPARARQQVRVWRDHVAAINEGDGAAAWFSEYLGTPLRLMRFAPEARRLSNPEFTREYRDQGLAKFADGYALLVIGEASLEDLNRRLEANGSDALPMNRFRPNLVLSDDDFGPYDEDRCTWLRTSGVALKPVKPCVRCRITTTDQLTAEVAAEPLLTLASYHTDEILGGPTFGHNVIVVEGAGRSLRVGDEIEVEWNF